MQHHPVICQHAVWGSKQQRFRHCKLPAKLSASLVDQIKRLETQCFVEKVETPMSDAPLNHDQESERKQQLDQFLEQRQQLLQPEYDAQRVLCGHHQKEAQAAQAALDQIEREKADGTYQDPEELKRLSKDQPVDPRDIPKDFLAAVERVFSSEPSAWVREVLDCWNGPEEWKMGRGGLGANHAELESDLGNRVVAGKAFPCHESYESLFADAGIKKKRHLAQESQLIQSMVSESLLGLVLDAAKEEEEEAGQKRRPVFVEFGAGTGGLSRHLQLVLETIVGNRTTASAASSSTTGDELAQRKADSSKVEPFNFVLLDRQKFRSRNQVDYMIRTQARPVKPRLLRITKDVRELKLKNLQLVHETEPGVARPDWTEGGEEVEPQEDSTKIPTHYICISKHFCGPATDLALAWIREQRQQQKLTQESQQAHPQDQFSICFATCCHGVCEPSLIVARPYLKELLNATCAKKRKRTESDSRSALETLSQSSEEEKPQPQNEVSDEQLGGWIPWMIKLTGWATLGKQEESSLIARPGKDTVPLKGVEDEGIMTRDQRRVLGKRCKKLLDMARCMYLIRECGFKQAKAIEYTEESIESGAIIGSM